MAGSCPYHGSYVQPPVPSSFLSYSAATSDAEGFRDDLPGGTLGTLDTPETLEMLEMLEMLGLLGLLGLQ